MNKIVDKKEVKGNKNEMCSRHKLKCETSKQLISENLNNFPKKHFTPIHYPAEI